MKHENLDAQKPKLPCKAAKRVDILLHGVAHIDHGADGRAPGFVAHMLQHPPDLGRAAAHRNLRHERGEPRPVGDETGGATFGGAPEKHKLHVKSAQRPRRLEHPALQALREIPGGLAAHRGVQRKHQTTALARRHRRNGGGLAQEGVHFTGALRGPGHGVLLPVAAQGIRGSKGGLDTTSYPPPETASRFVAGALFEYHAGPVGDGARGVQHARQHPVRLSPIDGVDRQALLRHFGVEDRILHQGIESLPQDG